MSGQLHDAFEPMISGDCGAINSPPSGHRLHFGCSRRWSKPFWQIEILWSCSEGSEPFTILSWRSLSSATQICYCCCRGRAEDGKTGTVFTPTRAPNYVIADQKRTFYVRNPLQLQSLREVPKPRLPMGRTIKSSKRPPRKFGRHWGREEPT